MWSRSAFPNLFLASSSVGKMTCCVESLNTKLSRVIRPMNSLELTCSTVTSTGFSSFFLGISHETKFFLMCARVIFHGVDSGVIIRISSFEVFTFLLQDIRETIYKVDIIA